MSDPVSDTNEPYFEPHDDAAPPVADLLDLGGRVALVTAASGGVGAGIAGRLAEAGAAIVVHYRGDERGATTVRDSIRAAGGRAMTIGAELVDRTAVDRVIAAAGDEFGGLDIVVNNAGAYRGTRVAPDAPDDDAWAEWSTEFDANLRTTVLVTRLAIPALRERSGGTIVNIASISALHPAHDQAAYVTAKAGVIGFTRAAAQELGPEGIRVNAVSPGLIGRPTLAEDWPDGFGRWMAKVPLGRVGTPQDIADACLFLASPASRWVTGQHLVVDGGMDATTIY
jgi:NAD(P)-dependent dehydrogenase (short-subunit alcohol dehydrogenase family)